MPFSNLLMMLTLVLFRAATASNHEIGGGAGWTAAGTVDYTNCASTNNFQVGDRLGQILYFIYYEIRFIYLITQYYVYVYELCMLFMNASNYFKLKLRNGQ